MMVNIIVVIIILFVVRFLYSRYFPVFGVSHLGCELVSVTDETAILDIRDYNVSYKKPVEGSVNIPMSYLYKHYGEVKGKSLIIISSDLVGKNMSIRFLRKKGFHIKGYYIKEDSSNTGLITQYNDKRRAVS